MGKRKKQPQNIVKLDLDDCAFGKGEILPVRVQHSSKDGRRVEQTFHKISAPPVNPPLPTFNPSLAFEAAQNNTPAEGCDPVDELNDSERARPSSLSLRDVV